MSKGVNTSLVKKMNTRLILDGLQHLRRATKPDLVRFTGLSVPTVNKIVDKLTETGQAVYTGEGINNGGRNAKLYEFNAAYAYDLCLFFNKTRLCFRVTDALGEETEAGSKEIPYAQYLETIRLLIWEMLQKYRNLKAIAIGVPAGVHNGKILFIPEYQNLQDMDLKGYFEARCKLPVCVENDVNAAALGYYTEQESKSEIMAAFYAGDNGLGAGILVNGEILHGFCGLCGEVGLIRINDTPIQQIAAQAMSAAQYADILCAVCAVINPRQIVLFKNDFICHSAGEISAELEKRIPSIAIPQIIESSDWKNLYLAGLRRLARLSREPQ